ncbi:hypothetical protein JOF56_000667 [Kibdelosporangium banguiense]|uniref:Uncharacterized protein n=1 Tax=Kibdelosporangium banguiense TaxID=1365924 RepID=A0ABS4T780_9PSEU|nr:hypothetical protein [Kibdelosporangium banguiense]MBP2320282.1 hypothetical protein [Kibdelosporangium banguiense]
MMARDDQLVHDLKTLRKGRGILASAIGSRVGPALRRASGTNGLEHAADLRRKLSDRLWRWSTELPEDLRLAVLAAFALDQPDQLPLYKDRVRLVAERLNRDERTARRRIDEGIERLAEVAIANSVPAGFTEPATSWHTEELRVTLALDQPTPEAFEFRRIVADHDRIEHVDLALALTANGLARGEDLEIDVFHGGRVAGRATEPADRSGYRLALPKALRRHESHQIGLRFRVRRDWLLAPHYVCVPKHRCSEFDLRVRFDLDHLPSRIWRLVNAFQRDVEDPEPRGEALPLDRSGEIHTLFRELTPGLAYGIRWHPGKGTGAA